MHFDLLQLAAAADKESFPPPPPTTEKEYNDHQDSDHSEITFYQGFRALHPKLSPQTSLVSIEATVETQTIITKRTVSMSHIFKSASPIGLGLAKRFQLSLFSNPIPQKRSLTNKSIDVVSRERTVDNHAFVSSNAIFSASQLFNSLLQERDSALAASEALESEMV